MNDSLKLDNTLERVDQLRERYIQEKKQIDARITRSSASVLDQTSEAVKALNSAKSQVLALDSQLKTLTNSASDSSSYNEFRLVSEVLKVRQSVIEILKVVEQFTTLSSDVSRLSALLDADIGRGNSSLPALDLSVPHLLHIHYQLRPLQDLYTTSQNYNDQMRVSTLSELNKFFAGLKILSERFENLLFDIAANMLELLREGNASLVVRMAKIIEVEETADKRHGVSTSSNTSTLQGGISPRSEHSSTLDLIQSIKVSSDYNRPPRNYFNRMLDQLSESIAEVFSNCRNAFLPGNPLDLLANLNWIFQDVGFAFSAIPSVVPDRWQIPEKYLEYCHENLNKLLLDLINSDPDAQVMLAILDFVREYKTNMTQTITENSPDGANTAILKTPLVESPLTGNKADNLLNDYLTLIIKKMNEWILSMANQERRTFLERTDPPLINDDDGKYMLSDTQTLFTMIHQQLDRAADTGQARVLARVVDSTASSLLDLQQKWTSYVHNETQRYIKEALGPSKSKDDTAEDDLHSGLPPGLLEYLTAVANDQIRCATYTEAIMARHSPLVSRKYKPQITAALEGVIDGNANLGEICLSDITTIILTDCHECFAEIFTKQWNSDKSSNSVNTIAATLRDYTTDLPDYLRDELRELFIDQVIEGTLATYLGQFYRKEPKVVMKKGKCIERMRDNASVLYDAFVALAPDAYVRSLFQAVEHTLGLLAIDAEDPSALVAAYTAMLNDFPDVSMSYVECVLKARDDIDSKTLKEALYILSEAAPVVPPTISHPTVLSKLRVSAALSG
ncbi:hypothetical protein CANCADRAFT_109341 [Tortispora caseinolytica NRRL Y-17796]|uniref:Uncharacterized protein n=1 Tax=Tortispora caseinolytica NRRL Y-17796 TaxID=767744 RepID=A0A1E4TFY0_9ASCO|nr:hypothetical protein CANCADRAFT_109341 [Tortispora caseinolytica NRRL Y-17796]